MPQSEQPSQPDSSELVARHSTPADAPPPEATTAPHATERAAQSETGEPEAREPGAGKPETGKPETGKPETGKPGAGEPGAARPGAAEPGAAESGAAESGAAESGAAESGAGKPEAGEPAAARGSVRRALGLLFVLASAAGGVGSAVQYAQYYGGEVAHGQVLRVDERVIRKTTSYRYLVRIERPGGEIAEAYLDSMDKLASDQRITVTYHQGGRRELLLGDGALQRLILQGFGITLLLGVILLVLARRRRR